MYRKGTRETAHEKNQAQKNTRRQKTHVWLRRAPSPLLLPNNSSPCLGLLLLFTSGALRGAGLGAGPDGQAERDLVHEVRKVVQQVQSGRGDTAHQVPEEVPERVDRPTDRYDAAHGAEGGLHMLVHGAAGSVHLTSLPVEDLVQDVPPAAHPQNEANGGIDDVRLATVAEQQ